MICENAFDRDVFKKNCSPHTVVSDRVVGAVRNEASKGESKREENLEEKKGENLRYHLLYYNYYLADTICYMIRHTWEGGSHNLFLSCELALILFL